MLVSSIKILTALALICFYTTGFAKEISSSETIKINFLYGKSQKSISDKESFKQKWIAACKLLGTHLSNGKGMFGSGVFDQYNCQIDGKTIVENVSGNPQWSLNVFLKSKRVIFQLKWRKRTEARLAFKWPKSGINVLTDRGISQLVAYGLTEKLTFLIKVDANEIKDGTDFKRSIAAISNATKKTSAQLRPPPELVFYSLEYSSGLWIPRVIATAKLEDYKRPSVAKSEGQATWTVKIIEPNKTSQQLWAHDSKGRGAKRVRVLKAIRKAIKEFEISSGVQSSDIASSVSDFIEDSAASGYVGFRYGRQALSGDQLLIDSQWLGFLAEIRGGPLSGIRFYYDTIPQNKTTDFSNGVAEPINVGWTRTTLGYSLGFDPGFILNRIDVVPKFGLWSFDARLPLPISESEVIYQSFKLDNQTAFALEIGMEASASIATIRIFGAKDMSFSFDDNNASQVDSDRFGIDLYLGIIPAFNTFGTPLKVALLGFFQYENVTLKGASNNEENESYEVDSLKYRSGHLGGGLAISW